MSSSVPWSVKGIDRKARETAKDLARRSGMTLGEWLNHVIEYQGEGKVTPLPQNATLNESIDRLTARIESVETRSTLAVTGIDQSVRGLAARIDAAEKVKTGAVGGDVAGAIRSLEGQLARIAAQVHENEAAQKAALGEIRDELGRVNRRLEQTEGGGAAAADKRLKAMEAQISHAEQRSSKAIDGIGQQVLLMAETVTRQIEGVDKRTTAAVERVDANVARVAEQIDGRLRLADEAQAAALEKLGVEIERITARLSERISQAASEPAAAQPTVLEASADENDFAASIFGQRIRRTEARTAALLDEARETVEQRLGEIHAPLEHQPEADEDEFVQPSTRTEALDPFAIDDDPFAGSAAPAANTDLAPAPVVYPNEDETRSAYSFAPQDFTPVEPETVADAAAAQEPDAEAESFGKVEFDAADPFTVDDEFVSTEARRADPFESDGDPETADEFAAAPAGADRRVETVDDEAVSIEPDGEAFEPGPFGRREETSDFHPADGEADEADAEASAEPAETAEAVHPGPEEQLSYLERARMAAREASKSDQKIGGRGGFSLGGFGFGGRKRGGAKLKNGLLMSTAVLICLGSGLAGAAMLAPLLKETGGKLSDKQGAKHAPVQPQAAIMTDPQPIAPQATAASGTPDAILAAPAKAPDPNASLIYAESLSLLSAKDSKGVEMLKKAAEQGYPQAELQLGHLYETGYPGLQSDLTQARKWTEKAAEAGLPSAMHNLAMLIYNGEGGPKSPALAAQWFRQAAELGQVDSQFNLGLLYENGKGVQANAAEAYKWFLLASRAGEPGARAEARAAAQRVRPLISPEAQAAAERAAEAYGVTQQAAK